MKWSATLFLGVLGLAIAGCSVPGAHNNPAAPSDDGELSSTADKRNDVHMELIRGMLDRGQYYAALAHIEDEKQKLGPDNIQLRLLEADARRQLGQTDKARGLYKSLERTAMQGQAEHGMGLLLAREGKLDDAITSLRKASEALPTDIDIRNDLGYALMQAGQYSQAMPQLSTAAELAPDQLRSRNNLIILMYLMGNERAALQLAHRSGLDPQALGKLRQDARNIQTQQKPNPVSSPAAG